MTYRVYGFPAFLRENPMSNRLAIINACAVAIILGAIILGGIASVRVPWAQAQALGRWQISSYAGYLHGSIATSPGAFAINTDTGDVYECTDGQCKKIH
jgi:hypothetical protein